MLHVELIDRTIQLEPPVVSEHYEYHQGISQQTLWASGMLF